MNTLKHLPVALTMVLALGACSNDDDDNILIGSGPLTEGVGLTLRNTLQEGGPEGSFPGLFGLPDDAYDEVATVSFSASEFPTALAQPESPAGNISGLYDINLQQSSIAFTVLPTAEDPFWMNVFEVFPAGKFDRYYLTFAEAHNISGSTSSNSSVRLRIDSPTVAVVEISEGYDLTPGMAFTISIE